MATMVDDTIVAIATPPGEGAIGVVRMSGPQALEVASGLFRAHAHTQIRPDEWKPQRAVHGAIHHPKTGDLLDEVIVTTFHAPKSYTGEDVVEISAHGSPTVLCQIVEACVAVQSSILNPQSSIRAAEPGEFTLRAFLNGKLDLAQAEAVADLIRAKTDLSARAALQQLAGKLGEEIRALQSQLVRLLTHLEASLDFPDDELEPWSPAEQLEVAQAAQTRIEQLLATYERGRILREGLTVVIAGKPNVGKSSLLNALLRRDRAIVTPIPGTTRDTLEELTNIKGVPVKAIDTAGLRANPDEVERLGIDRARAAIADADLVLLVLDGSQPLTEEDEELLHTVDEARRITVVNKCDLPAAWQIEDLSPRHPVTPSPCHLSALTGAGLADLEDAIHARSLGCAALDHEPTITRLRHQDALDRGRAALAHAMHAMEQQLPADIVSIPLRDCLAALGEITGENLIESAIHNIFAEFCIGK